MLPHNAAPREPLIAVIDDDDSFRSALTELLLTLGYEVRSFGSAEDFVAAGETVAYDCVITDIHMPGMSGLDLEELLQDSGLPVIMITARTERDLEARVAASGAVCLLRKPFKTTALQACLKKALDD